MTQNESAVARHDRMIREERLQAERVRSDRGGSGDIWGPMAERFRPAEEKQNPAVDALAELAGADGRAIDVGAGGGRLAVPLAGRLREVVAVEPSPSMRRVLEEEIEHRGLSNIRIIAGSWEDADVDEAELAFASHVTYGVQRIEPFLRKMDRVSTGYGALIAFANPPQHMLAPFWQYVYGEERLRLPTRGELLAALRELGAEVETTELPPMPVQPLGTPQDAYDELRRRLYVGDGSPLEARVREALCELAVERDGLVWPAQAVPNERSMIYWRAGAML